MHLHGTNKQAMARVRADPCITDDTEPVPRCLLGQHKMMRDVKLQMLPLAIGVLSICQMGLPSANRGLPSANRGLTSSLGVWPVPIGV